VLTFVITMIILLVISALVLLAVARGEGKHLGL
jgi:competence protein ComGC